MIHNDHADDLGRVRSEFFRAHAPCQAMVEVARLMPLDLLVEIEAEAVAR